MKPQIPFADADKSVVTQRTEDAVHFLEDAKGERFSPPFTDIGNLMTWKITRGLIAPDHPKHGSGLDAQETQDAQIREEMKFRHGR